MNLIWTSNRHARILQCQAILSKIHWKDYQKAVNQRFHKKPKLPLSGHTEVVRIGLEIFVPNMKTWNHLCLAAHPIPAGVLESRWGRDQDIKIKRWPNLWKIQNKIDTMKENPASRKCDLIACNWYFDKSREWGFANASYLGIFRGDSYKLHSMVPSGSENNSRPTAKEAKFSSKWTTEYYLQHGSLKFIK